MARTINYPNCSIIVLTFNTKGITQKCINDSLIAARYCEKRLNNEIEIIVVDNNSDDGTSEMIKKDYPKIKLVKSDRNLGYSGGNNLGMHKARYDYFLLLNSDAFLNKDTLYKAIKYMNSHRNCDALGCRQYFGNGKLQPSAGYLPKFGNTVLWLLGIDNLPIIRCFVNSVHPKNKNFFNKIKKVDWVMGAFLMLKREVYEATRGFNEHFFTYMEEVELCYRIKEKGFTVIYNPNLSITHLDKASSNFNLQKPLVNEMKGLVYYFSIHYPEHLNKIKTAILLGSFMRFIVFAITQNFPRKNAYKEIINAMLST